MQSAKRYYIAAAVIAAVMCFASVKTFAQKIGWIDAAKVLTNDDDAKKANDKLQAISKQWQDSLQTMVKAIQDKQEGYQKILSTMSDDAKQKAQSELNDMQKKAQDYNTEKFNQNDGELVKERNTLLQPILDKIHKAVVAVAKKKKLDFVLSKDAFVYPQTPEEIGNPDHVVDITDDVMKAVK